MRIRTILTAAAALVLLPLAPAHAGTGTANWCGDGIKNPGGIDLPILTYPVTVGIEIFNDPTDPRMQQIRVCFSDTPPGQPSQITGGSLALGVWTDTGTVTPGFYTRLECLPDLGATGFFPACNTPVGANVVPGEVRVTTPPNAFCLVGLGGGCVAYLPGVKVVTNGDPSRPLLGINLLGAPVLVSTPPPLTCVALLTSCP
jgi:hypothetical protein